MFDTSIVAAGIEAEAVQPDPAEAPFSTTEEMVMIREVALERAGISAVDVDSRGRSLSRPSSADVEAIRRALELATA